MPDRPGLVAIGTDMEPVPITGFAANFSPMPRIAAPLWSRRKGQVYLTVVYDLERRVWL